MEAARIEESACERICTGSRCCLCDCDDDDDDDDVPHQPTARSPSSSIGSRPGAKASWSALIPGGGGIMLWYSAAETWVSPSASHRVG
jgi:hypothetical protein